MVSEISPAFIQVARYYGSMALFLTITHNVFLLYYVDMFVNVFKIDKASFWIGEILFLIWNSVNDPLFGWLSDKNILNPKIDQRNNLEENIIVKRIKLLQTYGPLYAASFILIWVNWLPTALQFTICLCLYDGFLTVVDLQHTALLADLAVEADKRNLLNKYSTISSAIASVSVFLSYAAWDKSNPFYFQMFCLALALISGLGFIISSHYLLAVYNKFLFVSKSNLEKKGIVHSKPQAYQITVGKYIVQQASNNNFRCFVVMNLIQVFHCHFNSNFFPLFMDVLVGKDVYPGVGSILIGISFVVPHINNIYFLQLCKKYGLYYVIYGLFVTKLVMAVIMLQMGRQNILALCIFVACNRVFTEGTCKLLNLVLSDMVDEDFVLHDREHAASALLFGMTSLLSKPGQTLAPLVGTWLLSTYTGKEIFASGKSYLDQISINFQDTTTTWLSYPDACFAILIYIPIICAVLQIIAWNRFTLRDQRLSSIKNMRLCRNLDCV